MQNQDQSSETMPSNKLAQEIIGILFNSQNKVKYNMEQLLTIYRNKKNPNHQVAIIQQQKFSGYIQQELTDKKGELLDIIEKMKYLGAKLKQMSNSQSQIKSIVNGFRYYFSRYFQKQNLSTRIKKDFVLCLIRNYFQLISSFSILAAELIAQNLSKISQQSRQYLQKQIRQLVIDVIKSKNINQQDSFKCCAIIHEANFYRFFKIQDLVHISRNANINQIFFFFKEKSGKTIKPLAESYIIAYGSVDKKIEKFMSELKLNPLDYPLIIKQANKKSLRYFLKQQPIYSLDLKVNGRPDVVECLVQILIDENKQKQALHFINKYHLSKFYHLNPSNNRSYNKNVLEKFDKFQPTQMILGRCYPNGQYAESDYLCLSELGYEESSVIFIQEQNINNKILNNIQMSPYIGIDCESAPVYSTYEKRVTQIIQIAVNYSCHNLQLQKQQVLKEVYIFDFRNLANSVLFKNWFSNFCRSYTGKIVGHTVKKQFQDLVKQININTEIKQMQKLNFVDVAQKFKQKYKQSKSSLQYISKYMLNRNLSKFQQCSGWHNRPLRKAQLHYAALDAVIPLKVFKKLL